MTVNEFDLGLMADPLIAKDGFRIRVKVANALERRARELRKIGDVRRAGQLMYIDSRIRVGLAPSARVMRRAAKEIELARARSCDGVPEARKRVGRSHAPILINSDF